MTCNNCGAEIDSVIVNHFNYKGADEPLELLLTELDNNTYGVAVGTHWTGYGLDEADQRETIWCPYCKRFPFKSKEINTEEVVYITCWN